MKKKIDKLFEIIIKRVDFVNLTIKVKFFKGFEIYNNNDRIAFLTFEDTHVLLMLAHNFCSIVYSLCVKYSIEKFELRVIIQNITYILYYFGGQAE